MKKIKSHYRSHLADTVTPVGIYLNLRDRFPGALLLESSDYHDRTDSMSFICLQPIAGFKATGIEIEQFIQTESQNSSADNPKAVWDAFKAFVGSFEAESESNRFSTCGLFGYTSFDAVQYFEDLEFDKSKREANPIPDLCYQLFRYVICVDHYKSELQLVRNYFDYESEDQQALEDLHALITVRRLYRFSFDVNGDESSNLEGDIYKEMVTQGKHHCQQGDVFQVVLSRSFERSFTGDDFNVYRTIRNVNPSPFLFYFDYGDYKIFGSSPESQLLIENGKAYISPIAGTMKRSGDTRVDLERAEELKADPKEQSEHIMLVDLARNDLNRNAVDVKVEEYGEVQFFSHVIHMVSKVSGTIQEGRSGLDVFADTFPAGTLSGAPKYRAMQIIDSLEPTSRGFYGGAIGFIGFDGNMNQAIIIRSVLSRQNKLRFQAGAGVVIGSTPDGELQEVNNKVGAMRSAIQNATEL